MRSSKGESGTACGFSTAVFTGVLYPVTTKTSKRRNPAMTLSRSMAVAKTKNARSECCGKRTAVTTWITSSRRTILSEIEWNRDGMDLFVYHPLVLIAGSQVITCNYHIIVFQLLVLVLALVAVLVVVLVVTAVAFVVVLLVVLVLVLALVLALGLVLVVVVVVVAALVVVVGVVVVVVVVAAL